MTNVKWPGAFAILVVVLGLGFAVHSCTQTEIAKEQTKVDLEKNCLQAGGNYKTSIFGKPRCKLPKARD